MKTIKEIWEDVLFKFSTEVMSRRESNIISDLEKKYFIGEYKSFKQSPPADYQMVIWLDSRDNKWNHGYFVWSQTKVDYAVKWFAAPTDANLESKEN